VNTNRCVRLEAISTLGARRRAILIAVLTILAGGLGAFSNSFKGQFIFDDLLALTQNASTEHWWRLDQTLNPPVNMTTGGRPILNASFAVDRAIFGLKPFGYHIGNLAIHLGAALLLFGIVRRTWQGGDGVWIAGAVALLWVVHPLQTESVTYVVQRAESLMGFFYLLALYCFIRASASSERAERAGWSATSGRAEPTSGTAQAGDGENLIAEPNSDQRARRSRSTIGSFVLGQGGLILSLAACWLGMATKEAMVSAPLIILLYDRAFVAGSFAAAWQERRGYYLAMFASWILLAILILGTHGRGGTVGVGFGVGVIQYWMSQFPALVRYLWLCFWPNPLVFDYGTEWVDNLAELVPCVAVVAILLGVTVQGLRRNSAVGVAGGFFWAILAPTSLMPGIRQTAAEHRMYLPLAAVLLAAVAGAYSAWGRRTLWVWLLAALPLGRATWERNRLYAHPVALWQDTVARRPTNPYSRNNYGGALLAAHLPANAVIQLEESVRLKPDFLEGHANLCSALLGTGDVRGAVREGAIAVELGPQHASVHNNYGVALLTAREFDAAETQFRAALRLDPEFGEAANNLGNVKLRTNHPAEAAEWYRRALAINPRLPRTRELLAQAEKLSAAPPPSTAR